MAILIKGMEMPKGVDEHRLIIRANGQVIIDKKTYFEETEAVPVPPHGRLIDADALKFTHADYTFDEPDPHDYIRRYAIDNAPTIIEAEDEP